jgi:hypothetical protein
MSINFYFCISLWISFSRFVRTIDGSPEGVNAYGQRTGLDLWRGLACFQRKEVVFRPRIKNAGLWPAFYLFTAFRRYP